MASLTYGINMPAAPREGMVHGTKGNIKLDASMHALNKFTVHVTGEVKVSCMHSNSIDKGMLCTAARYIVTWVLCMSATIAQMVLVYACLVVCVAHIRWLYAFASQPPHCQYIQVRRTSPFFYVQIQGLPQSVPYAFYPSLPCRVQRVLVCANRPRALDNGVPRH